MSDTEVDAMCEAVRETKEKVGISVCGSFGLLNEQQFRRIEEITRREMEGFSDPRIKEIRIMGACVCIEVYDSNTIKEYQQFAYKRGVFSRPFLNYLYAMVPYVIEEDELVKVLQTMKEWFSEKC